jgi:hypothetical protein
VAPLLAACLDPGRVRVLRPALRAGRLGINMARRKKHTPEQVVRKLAAADREPPPRQVHDLAAVAPDLVFTVLAYGPSPLYGPPLVRNFSSPGQQISQVTAPRHRLRPNLVPRQVRHDDLQRPGLSAFRSSGAVH